MYNYQNKYSLQTSIEYMIEEVQVPLGTNTVLCRCEKTPNLV